MVEKCSIIMVVELNYFFFKLRTFVKTSTIKIVGH